MTNLEILQEKIGKISNLLEKPEVGLITWQMALNEAVNDLVTWWTDDE